MSTVNNLELKKSASFDSKTTDIKHVEDAAKFKPSLGNMDEEVAEFADSNIVISPEDDKRLKRMIDKHVLLVMLGCYFCQSLDKGTLSFASIMGIKSDAKLVGQQYSWLTTCLYLAVLVSEFPQNFLIQRLPIAKYFSFNIIAWGIVVGCSAAANNFVGLCVLRCLLGVFESSIQPTFLRLTSTWYKRDEQAGTIAMWYAMNGLQTAVGGLIAYGFFHVTGAALKSWQVMYLTLGILTVVWGTFVFWWLPDSPMRSGRFFSEQDRRMMVERVRKNDTGIQDKHFKIEQIWEAVRDPQTWAFFLIQVLNTIPTGGLGAYSNIIITTNLGFSTLQADLLSIAQGTWQICVLLGAAWLAKKTNQTLLVMILFTLPNIVSAVCFLTVPNNKAHAAGLLIAFYCTIFFNAQSSLSFSLLTRNVAGQTKKSFITAITFIAWSAGNAAGPQLFQARDAPLYRKAFAGQLACYVASILVFLLLRIYYMRQNALKRKNARDFIEGGAEIDDDNRDHNLAFEDITDLENPEFRYSY